MSSEKNGKGPVSDTQQPEISRPCKFCLRLVDEEICLECQRHNDSLGHYPAPIRWQQAPGQPRVLTRVCGACGRELS